jgi:hypothetical protein
VTLEGIELRNWNKSVGGQLSIDVERNLLRVMLLRHQILPPDRWQGICYHLTARLTTGCPNRLVPESLETP